MGITIKDVSEKTGWSTRRIQRFIASHFELGIVTEERKKTVLTQHQATQLCALIAQECADSAPISVQNSEIDANIASASASLTQECAEFKQYSATKADESLPVDLVQELYRQIQSLSERAARAEGRAEELENQVRDLKDQREKSDEARRVLEGDIAGIRGLLESAESKAEKAEAEVNSFKPSIFGFYRKQG